MRLNIIPILLLSLLPSFLLGQEKTDSISNTESFNFLMGSLGYTSNNDNSRNANAIRMPAMIGSINFYSKTGFWGSATALNYITPTDLTIDTELHLGYQKTLLKYIDIDFYYSNRYFRGDRTYEGISYNHSFTLSGAFNFQDFSFELDNEFMIGPKNNFFTDLSLSYDFSIDGVFGTYDYLVISPTLVASFGTTYWISDVMDHVWGEHSGDHHMGGMDSQDNFTYQRSSIIVPVLYSLGSFSISGGVFYSIPSQALKTNNWSNQFGILASVIYTAIL